MTEEPFSPEHSEPTFMALKRDSPELQRCRDSAQRSFDLFADLFAKHRTNLGVYFAVKVPVVDGDDVAHLWYSFTGLKDELVTGEHFELPPALSDRKHLVAHRDQVEDWMINDHGVLYGGWSIRYQRSLLPAGEHARFDEYAGIREYKDI